MDFLPQFVNTKGSFILQSLWYESQTVSFSAPPLLTCQCRCCCRCRQKKSVVFIAAPIGRLIVSAGESGIGNWGSGIYMAGIWDRDRDSGTLAIPDAVSWKTADHQIGIAAPGLCLWSTGRLKDWRTERPFKLHWVESESEAQVEADVVWAIPLYRLYPSDLHLHLKPLLKLKLYLKPKLKRWCSSFFGFRGPGNWFAIPWGALILIDHDRRAIRSLVGAFPSQFLWVYGAPSIKPPSDFIF